MISVGINNRSALYSYDNMGHSVVEEIAKNSQNLVHKTMYDLLRENNTIKVTRDLPRYLFGLVALVAEFHYIEQRSRLLNMDIDALLPDNDPRVMEIMNKVEEQNLSIFFNNGINIQLDDVRALPPKTVRDLENILRESFNLIYLTSGITPVLVFVEYED